MSDKFKCDKHPKYTGKREPRANCEKCLSFYFVVNKNRAPIVPTKVIPDKTKYSRKEKHKN
jgi:hypothetical protein